MKLHGFRHSWNLSPTEARDVQNRVRKLVVTEDRLGKIRCLAGVDVGFEDDNKTTRAAVAVLDFPGLDLVDSAVARTRTSFPYIPGLLSFREIPAILKALAALKTTPDLLLCDGQGIAHPRRCGLASHLGVITDIPSIGVAKSRLIGEHAALPEEKGSSVPLCQGKEILGAALRTRTGVKPLYISVGHRVSLNTAIRYVLACTTKYRLPETTRQAHRLASG